MFDSLVSTDNLSFILVFLEGMLSFLSPCVIPLIPVYMSYLAGNTKQTDDNGIITYKRSAVFLHTVFFVLGISFSFFLLGMAFTALGSFFRTNQLIFTRTGGILIIFLGLYQTGLLKINFLQKERKIRFIPDESKMNPLAAFIMGFTFSFAWTPCVGPALSSVLILASGSQNSFIGYLLVLIYTAGFIIPFLLLGLFTTQVLNFLKARQKILKYTVKVGGLILILIGIMTLTGWMNGISKYFNKISRPLGVNQEQTDENEVAYESSMNSNNELTENNTGGKSIDSGFSGSGSDIDNTSSANNYSNNPSGTNNSNSYTGDYSDTNTDSSKSDNQSVTNDINSKPGVNPDNNVDSSKLEDTSGNNTGNTTSENNKADVEEEDDEESEDSEKKYPAINFTLKDQYGNEHTLSNYKGKVVFLNFWTTWCPYCIKEMPDIEKIYKKYGKNQKDVIILGVANPSSDEHPNNQDVSKEEIIAFLENNGFTFPVVFDETGQVLEDYYIYAFPTTFLIDKEGNIYGYAAAMLSESIMDNVINDVLNTTD